MRASTFPWKAGVDENNPKTRELRGAVRAPGAGTEFEASGAASGIRRAKRLSPAAFLLFWAFAAHGQGLGLRLEAGYQYDDNVTRARQRSSDVLSDQSFAVTASASRNFSLSQRIRLALNAGVTGEKFVDYPGLDRASVNVGGSLQFRPSGAFLAPTYAFYVRWSGDWFDSSLRDGNRYALGLSVRKPLTDRIQALAAVQFSHRDGKSIVFDGNDWSGRLNLDYTLFGRHTLYAGGEYRRGDVVSVGVPSLPMINLANALVQDDVFVDRTRFAYRFHAATVIATVGYNFPFGTAHSLDLSYRWIRSEPSNVPAYYGTQGIRYVANQINLAYLARF